MFCLEYGSNQLHKSSEIVGSCCIFYVLCIVVVKMHISNPPMNIQLEMEVYTEDEFDIRRWQTELLIT